jgi:nicotinamide-nucleotide amidase
MSAAVLCIGTELTRGELVNTNAPFLAAGLTDLGFNVTALETVDDDEARIVESLRRLSASHRVLLVSGGLGPTTDDLTSAAVARAMGVGLVRHEPSLEAIRRRFEKLGRSMSPSNEKQADVPEGAEVLPNGHGTAPAFAVFIGECRAFFLPGVPRELEPLYVGQIAPRLRAIVVNDSHQVRLKTFGLPESVVGERLAGLEAAHAGLTLGYRATFPEIEVKVHVRAASQGAARASAHSIAEEVRQRLGPHVYGDGEDSFPEAVGRAVRARGFRLALAESCTGGLIGHLLTSVPASEFFVADAVTYANSAKATLLGVSEDVLRAHGAVSAEVAVAMAEGIKRVCDVDLALAVTGIAGPTGGTPEKPVGLVFWAVTHRGGTLVKSRVLGGDRAQIQRLAAYVGMSLVRDVCLEDDRKSAVMRVAG